MSIDLTKGEQYVGYEDHPTLVGGSAGDDVFELMDALHALGYPSKISEGKAEPVLTDDAFSTVLRFQRERMDRDAVREELNSAGLREGDVIVGPATWAAITRELGGPEQ